MLTGTVRDGGGEIRTVSGLVPRVPRVPAAVHARATAAALEAHQLRARRRPGARRDRRDAAAREPAGRRHGPPVGAAVGAVARLAARHPARVRPTRRPTKPPPARRSPSSSRWCRTRPSQSAPRSTAPTTAGNELPVDDPTRKLKLQAQAGAAGSPRRLGRGQPVLVQARLHAAAGRVPARACPAAARALRALPGEHHPALAATTAVTPSAGTAATMKYLDLSVVRVTPALAGPRAGARGSACRSSTGASRAPCRRRARRELSTRRDQRRDHAAARTDDQDHRRRGRGTAAVHRQRGPRRRLRRPGAKSATASSPGSGWPGSPTRCPRSSSTSPWPTSGSWCPSPARPRSCPSTTRGCAGRPR